MAKYLTMSGSFSYAVPPRVILRQIDVSGSVLLAATGVGDMITHGRSFPGAGLEGSVS